MLDNTENLNSEEGKQPKTKSKKTSFYLRNSILTQL